LDRQEEPLVITAEGGLFSPKYMYLTSYKGFVFYAQTKLAQELPSSCEIITSGKIWIP
jgi:hypothetical protein